MKGLFKKSIKSIRRPDKSQASKPTEPNNQRDAYTAQLEDASQVSKPAESNNQLDYNAQLEDASSELNETLQEYFERTIDQPKDTPKQLYTQASNPEQLAELIQNVIINETGQKKGLSRQVSDTFGKIYPFATLVLKFGTAAGEAFQPVKALMSSLDLLLQLTEEERTRAEGFVNNLENIAYQCARVTELQKIISNKEEWNHLVIQKSTQLLTVIIQYFNVSIRFFCQGVWQSVGQSVLHGQQRYSGVLEKLKIAISEYDQALLLQIAVTTLSTSTRIRDKSNNNVNGEVMKWLNSAYWETEAQLASLCNKRTEDSFQWILGLEMFKQWRNRDQTSLWLTASPGFGKSTLAAYLVQLLLLETDADALVLFFFCRNANPNLRTLECLIRTLAAQILKKIPASQDYFQRLRDQGFESNDPSLLFDNLVREPLSKSKFSGKVYIVVDGLDELSEDSSGDTFTMLQKLPGQLILTSRPISIPTSSSYKNVLHHRLTTENSSDIKTYVAHRLSESLFLQKGFSMLQNNEPSTLLAEKSQGNFLWTFTLLRLLDKPSLSVSQFQSLLADVHEPLNQVYVEVLDRLGQTDSLELARFVLRCVLFSVSPLTVEMLQAAVLILHAEVIGFREFIESECGSILTIIPGDEDDGRADIVQVTHETFKSFITSSEAAGERKLSARESHRYLAVACLECLLKPDKNKESLREYAMKNWFAHFQQQEQEENTQDDFNSRLLSCLHDFCTTQDIFCAWLRDLMFLIQDDARMRFFCFELVDIHESIRKWLAGLNLDNSSADLLKESNRNWRNQLIDEKTPDLAQNICKCFAQTWLRTNWETSVLSHWVFLQVKKTAQMLLWDEDSSKPHTRSISHTDFSSTTMQQVQSLGELGGFLPAIGVQAGNYAFGCLAAKDPSCARYFLSALDEYPDWWHLHESLGEWYYRNNDKRKALQAFEMAMKHDKNHDPTSAPSNVTHMYWTTRCDICLEDNDPAGAVETLRQACRDCPADSVSATRYWDRMASIWRDRERWDELKIIYNEALSKRSVCRDDYWMGLAEACEKLRDWKGLIEILLSALKDDPENSRRYANRICRFAMELNDCMLFDQSVEVLCSAIRENASNRRQYLVLLARTYMAARKCDKAVETVKLLDDEDESIDKDLRTLLGHAHLAMGHLNEARAAFEKQQQGEITRLPDILALGYIIDGQFPEAIRILKQCISYAYTQNPTGVTDTTQAGMLMGMHLNLGNCYQATGRDEDARQAYDTGITAFQSLKDEIHNNLPSSDDAETPLWRCDARVLMIYGELLERVGETIKAGQQYEIAQKIMSKTRFVEDDDILEWEYQNCVEACERVTSGMALTHLVDTQKILESRICCLYRVEWYSFMKSEAPRFRGGDSGWSTKALTDTKKD